MKRKSLLLLIPLAVVGLAGCSPALKPCEQAVITYKDGATSMTIAVNETKQVPYEIQGGQCSGQIKWTSTDGSVVTIDSDGKVTGHKEGTAVIKANGVSEFTVKVEGTGPGPVDPIVVAILSVKGPTTVNVNETISPSQVILNVKMSDDTECTKIATSVTCDTSKAAESVVATAYYGELSTTFNIKVVAQGEPVYGTEDSPISVSQALTTMSIDCPEDKNLTKQAIYCTGEVKAISKSGVYDPGDNYFELTATDGTSDILVYRLHATDALKDKVVEGATIKWVGYGKNFKGTLEFVDNGDNKCTLLDNGQPIPPEKEVTSIEVKGTPKTEYYEGESFDGSQMKLLVHYSDDSSEEISSGWTVSPSGALAATDKVVTISYGGQTTTVNVDVTARELLKIEVTKSPNKTSYYAGDKFDPSGMVVTATYNFGDPATITNYDYSPKGDLTLSDTSIDIVYEGKHASVTISVSERPGPVSCDVEYTVKNGATQDGSAEIYEEDVLDEIREGKVKGDDILSSAEVTKVYEAPNAFKLGSSSAAGSIKLTLSKNVTKIVIGAKAFKDSENSLVVNNKEVELTGEYDKYQVDVSSTKTVEVKTLTKRAYVNYFGFITETSGPVVKSVTVSPKSATVEMESTKQLVATVEVDGGASKDVTWTSSNTAVATVNESGVVTPVSVGKATITVASAVSGFADKKDTCEITVIAKQQPIVESISLDKSACSIEKDGTVLLKATVIAVGGASEQVTWGSSNESIATVNSSGLVTGVAVGGPVTITATSVGDPTKSATCNVTVTPKQEPVVESVSVTSETGTSVSAGNSIKLKATVVAKGGASESVTWKSSNESIATVDQNGLVKGVSEGPVTITATSVFNTQVSGSLDLTVLPKPADATFTAVTSANDLADGMSFALVGTYNGVDYALSTNLIADKKYIKADKVTVSGTGDKTIKLDDGSDVELFTLVKAGNFWSIKTSENKYLIASGTVKRGTNTNYIEFADNNTDPDSTFSVTFEGGLATFESQGDAKSRYILFNYNQGTNPIFSCYTAATTTIVAPVIYKINAPATPEVKSITFDPNEVEVEMESTKTLVPIVEAIGVTKEVSFSSSDESVATVDARGTVTPKAVGETIITATSKAEGFTDVKGECKVTVIPKADPEVVSITIKSESTSVEAGKTLDLDVDVVVRGGASDAVIWSSSNENIATIDQNGLVKGISAGSTVITASSSVSGFESVKDTVTIVVKDAPIFANSTFDITGYSKDTGVATFTDSGETGATLVASGNGYGFDDDRGIQFSKVDSTITISDLPANTRITKITVDASSNGANAVVSAKVGGVAFGTDVNLPNANHTSVVFEGSMEGNSVVITTTASSKSTWIKSVSLEWEVTKIVPKVNSITFNPDNIELELGTTKKLTPIVDAVGGATEGVHWVSLKTSTVEVDQEGNLTPKMEGTAKIQASSLEPGFTHVVGECTVTVIPKQDPEIKSITVDPSETEVEVGKDIELNAIVDARGGLAETVVWSSEDDTIATVDQTGKVTGVKAGTVKIYANSDVAGYESICGYATITVNNPAPASVTVSKTINALAEENEWTSGTSIIKDFNLDSVISVSTADGDGASGSIFGSTTLDWRIYHTDNGTIDISAASGYKIVSVKITYSVDKNGVLKLGNDKVSSGDVVNVNDTSISFWVDGGEKNKTNGQVRVSAIEVIYVAI